MRHKLQTNFNLVRLYDEKNVPPPVTKVGILPFIVTSESPLPLAGGRGRESRQEFPLNPPAGGGKMVRANLHFLFMKPCAEARHLGAPAFQIAKGTRRINVSGEWCDMREDDLMHADESFFEPLLETALREGAEEVGLRHTNIRRLFDLGGFTFISASKKLVKPLHMFAAEIIEAKDFTSFEASTSETCWMSAEEFKKAGRADHIAIVEAIMERLQGFLE